MMRGNLSRRLTDGVTYLMNWSHSLMFFVNYKSTALWVMKLLVLIQAVQEMMMAG